MGMKKVLSLALAMMMVMILLASCGANSAPMDYMENSKAEMGYDGVYDAAGDYEMPMEPGTTTAASDKATMEQKLIKTVNMSVETEELNSLLENISAQVDSLGGYVQSRNVYNGSAYSGSRSRNAELTIRIPAANLDGFVGKVKDMSNITSANEQVEDVTLSYVAVESRMNALQTEHDRLLELLAQAETMSDLLEVEARLTQVVSELESVTSQLRVLQNRVDYATVELYIREVQVLTVVDEETVWQRMTRGFGENLKGLGNGIVEFVIFLVVSLPYLVPLGAVVTLVVVLIRRGKARKKVLKNPPFEADTPENKE